MVPLPESYWSISGEENLSHGAQPTSKNYQTILPYRWRSRVENHAGFLSWSWRDCEAWPDCSFAGAVADWSFQATDYCATVRRNGK